MKSILLDHGSGGRAGQELISNMFLKYLTNPALALLEDCAVMEKQEGRIAFTTDSYVVDPIFFPGGNIGELAVNGTINDLAMRGASPLCLSLGLILEEGFPEDDLERVIASVAAVSEKSAVPVVTGDTKVLPRGKGDKIFINTSGIGVIADGCDISWTRAKSGDAIILSGTLADHGITIMTSRAGLRVEGKLSSDTMALHRLVGKIVGRFPGLVHTMRDPTRGGLATTLSEIALSSGLCMEIEQNAIPIKPQVRAACELMGLDPLYLANEGKCIVIADPDTAEEMVTVMREMEEGRDASIIGRVSTAYPGKVVMTTGVGGKRLVEPLSGEPLPRIC